MKLGLMGGTFNPPHNGHLLAAQTAKNALGLEQVLFIPTNVPPHKQLPRGSATTNQRCEMVRLLIKDCPWAALSTIEIERGGASYTVDTLRQLHRSGYDDLTMIVGTDMLLSLDTAWREPEEICRLCAFAVCARNPGEQAKLTQKATKLTDLFGAKISVLELQPFPVSSTELRQGRALEGKMPKAVLEYICQNRLYAD